MKIPEFAIVATEDWIGLYINGKLADENHSFSAKEVCNIFKFPVTFYKGSEHAVISNNGFPDDLKKIIK